MVVQTYFPRKLSAARYDQYLASGWFRGSVMLYKMGLLCLEGEVQSVLNVRMDIRKFEASKSQRKLLSRGKTTFRTTVRKAKIDRRREALYTEHKPRFKGFIHRTLSDYLNSGYSAPVFDTYEVAVWQGEELVASSFFDVGDNAMASLLCVYKQGMGRYSLGKLTMLCELEFAQKKGLKWYYPGYVLNPSPSFDYKLELGTFQYYNNNRRWVALPDPKPTDSLGIRYEQTLDDLQKQLQSIGIENKRWMYPFFTMGYLDYWEVHFMGCPIFLEVPFGRPGKEMLIVTYQADSQHYLLLLATPAEEYYHLLNMEVSEDFYGHSSYFMDLLSISQLVMATASLEEILDATFRIANAAPGDLT